MDSTTLQARVPPNREPSSSVPGKLGQPGVRVDVVVSNPGSDRLPKAYRYMPQEQKTL